MIDWGPVIFCGWLLFLACVFGAWISNMTD